MTARIIAKKVADLMLSKKAQDVVILDLKKLTSATDYFVICTADSDTQVKAIAEAVRDGMEKSGEPVWHYEGYHALKWIVLDFVDVVAHIFYKEERSFYNLDRLWGDAKRLEVKDEVSEQKIQRKHDKSSTKKTTKKR